MKRFICYVTACVPSWGLNLQCRCSNWGLQFAGNSSSMGRQSRSIFWLNSHACLLHIAKLVKIANIVVVLYVITEMDVCWCDVMYILKHPYKEDFKLILRCNDHFLCCHLYNNKCNVVPIWSVRAPFWACDS